MVVEQHEGRAGEGNFGLLLHEAGLHNGRRLDSGSRVGTTVPAETQWQQRAKRGRSLDGRLVVPGVVESHPHRDKALTVAQGESCSGTPQVVAQTRTAVSFGDHGAPGAAPGH